MKFKTLLFLIIFIFLFSIISSIYFPGEDNLPALIFVYDDGYKEDIELALPIHQKYEIPAVSAVNSSVIGNANFLDEDDLLLLVNNGWEIASHGKYHTALIYSSIKEDINKGDKNIKINNSNIIELRYPYYIYDNGQQQGEVINLDKRLNIDGDTYFKLSDEIKQQYKKESSYVMLTKTSMVNEIVNSKKELEKIGLEINNFVYPYNGYINSAREIVKEHYIFARGGPKNGQDFPARFINYFPLSRYNLKGIAFEKNQINKEEIDEILNSAAEEKALLIFYAHTGNKNFSPNQLKYIIKTAKKLNYNITTFSELIGN